MRVRKFGSIKIVDSRTLSEPAALMLCKKHRSALMKTKIFLLINLALIIAIFMFGNLMTTTPGRSSGNGNPTILLVPPLLICFIILVIQWISIFKGKRYNIRTITSIFLFILVHFICGVYYQMLSFSKYRAYLAEVYANQFGNVDWQYINSITTGFSIHMNNQFFNWNTYLLFVSLSILMWLLSYMIKESVRSTQL